MEPHTFSEALQYGCEIFHTLKSKLEKNGLNTNVGDEGGFAPDINSSKKTIEFILESVITPQVLFLEKI